MGDIKTIDGREFAPPGEVNLDCIAACERQLEMARSGEIIGVAWAAQCGDGAFRRGAAGMYACYGVLASVDLLAADIRRVIFNAEDN